MQSPIDGPVMRLYIQQVFISRDNGQLSFTQRFVGALQEIYSCKPENSAIDPTEIIGLLQQQKSSCDAGHTVISGDKRLSFYFHDRLVRRDNSTQKSLAKVILKMTMPITPEDPESTDVISTLRKLAIVAGLEILSIDETNSTLIIFRIDANCGIPLSLQKFEDISIELIAWSYNNFEIRNFSFDADQRKDDSQSRTLEKEKFTVYRSLSSPSSPRKIGSV